MTKGLSIEFSGLEAGYGGVPVLKGFRGSIRPKTLTALIGPNGSGKSTLLRTLAGLLPYKGSLTLSADWEPREVCRISRRELGRLVGVVPQQARPAAPFTVYDAVALGRLPFGGTGDDQLILDAIAQTDLEHLMLREVTRLSAGEAQRVLLATVLAQDPPMLLLDEPSSALDPRQTARVFSLLRYLAASGKTVVAAVHDVNLAVAYADAFLALRKPAEKAGKNANGANKVDEDEGFPWTASAEELDEKVLERIYDAPFDSYISHRGAKVWHVRVN